MTIFVSHSSLDKASLVEPLVQHLNKAGYSIWYDTEQISLGDSIPLTISQGLRRSTLFLIAISENYHQSPWCQRELAAIVASAVGKSKRIVILRIGDATIPDIISDLAWIDVSLSEPGSVSAVTETIANLLRTMQFGTYAPTITNSQLLNSDAFVESLFSADKDRRFGENLIESRSSSDNRVFAENSMRPKSEGVILIKPGGTFYRPCLRQIFDRIARLCDIRQMRLFNGSRIDEKGLFDQQYATSVQIATGEVPLTTDDYARISAIYDRPEFETHFGQLYNDSLVLPAFKLRDPPYSINSQEITKIWEIGRSQTLFRNRRWDGLNKIGFQKSVFPTILKCASGWPVRIILNGFVPGYRCLFTDDSARTVAIRVVTPHPWSVIREQIVGGDSDPSACVDGSIRKDAYLSRIELDPKDALVNGQRNVCHSSATLLDGMREIAIWFDATFNETLLGKTLELLGISRSELQKVTEKSLWAMSWSGRDRSVDELFYDVRQRIVRENVRGASKEVKDAIRSFAKEAEVMHSAVRGFPELDAFVGNGIRLKIGGEAFFLNLLGEQFSDEVMRAQYFETVREIHYVAKSMNVRISQEDLAEAYTIAASDLRFRDAFAYRDLANPNLFHATMLSQLPEQALACALRTHKNIVRDLATVRSQHRPRRGRSIRESREWIDFVNRETDYVHSDSRKVAIILAGGRSTRMRSTIPKAVLPWGKTLLIRQIVETLKRATDDDVKCFAAIGYRGDLVRLAIGSRFGYLKYPHTLGLGFRVATCLHTIKRCEGIVILMYTDMPLIPDVEIKRLIEKVENEKTFGLLLSHSMDLSGHVKRNKVGQVERIIQRRLHPEKCFEGMERDAGVYVFHNSLAFREALADIRNDNPRKEYIFADVVERLHARSWNIVTQEVDATYTYGINTSADLIFAASGAYKDTEIPGKISQRLREDFGLNIPTFQNLAQFQAAAKAHCGPFYLFSWWDRHW